MTTMNAIFYFWLIGTVFHAGRGWEYGLGSISRPVQNAARQALTIAAIWPVHVVFWILILLAHSITFVARRLGGLKNPSSNV